jgi:predicted DNA-binding protein (MmcQ/YjbR family)
LKRLEAALLKHALALPEATEDHPWGHTVAKVRKKIFFFIGKPDEGISISVKLPQSGPFALDLPCTAPTAYGMGRSGWVTASLTKASDLPPALLKGWIEESYRAIAPKKLLASLEAEAPSSATRSAARRRKSSL